MACCVYVKVAVYAFIAWCVVVEGEDGVEDEKADEAEADKDEDADIKDAPPREMVITDVVRLGVMETILVVNGIKEVVGGIVVVGDETPTDGGEGGLAVVPIEGTTPGYGGGSNGAVAVTRGSRGDEM